MLVPSGVSWEAQQPGKPCCSSLNDSVTDNASDREYREEKSLLRKGKIEKRKFTERVRIRYKKPERSGN